MLTTCGHLRYCNKQKSTAAQITFPPQTTFMKETSVKLLTPTTCKQVFFFLFHLDFKNWSQSLKKVFFFFMYVKYDLKSTGQVGSAVETLLSMCSGLHNAEIKPNA